MIDRSISHYKIVKQLGRGGMATVYEAVDLNCQGTVALKVLSTNLSSDNVVRKRFLREGKLGMELNHPGIAKVYEVGEAENESFIAMELVQGETLDAVLQREGVDVERSIGICFKVADALAAAHEKNIVHRDLKPKNIMVSGNNVKVMDFGLARVLETSSLTKRHEILGTLHYMSPQQAIGDKIDGRSDIFSLGVVLYEMLTGSLPFAGDHPGAIIHSLLYSDPLRISELSKNVPVEVEQVVFKALKKKPRERYQSAFELKSDLGRVREIFKGKTIELIATKEVFEEPERGVYSDFVGREQEMEYLEESLAEVLKGESSVIMVGGEAGVGKSRLVWEFGKSAKEKKVRYLKGRCLLGERSIPYQAILEIISSYFELKGIRTSESLRDFIENKVPHLANRLEIVQTLLLMRQERVEILTNKKQLWDTALELVKVMTADKPLIFHLDDLHWADLPTLSLLTYIAVNTGGMKVLIIGTYRPEELTTEEKGSPHRLHATLENLKKETLYKEIQLNRLDKKATVDVIASVFSDSNFPESFTDSIYNETEGNPLFILEALKLLREEELIGKDDTGWVLRSNMPEFSVPGRVSDVIMNRLRRLSQEERSILDVASIEGPSFQSDTICHCLNRPRIKVLRCLQNLESAHHIVHASERDYHFDHGKIREVVYDNLIPELKKEYHKFIGEYFEENFGDEVTFAGKIAHHLIGADKEKEALPYLVAAGDYAAKLFANEEALGYFTTAAGYVDKHLRQRPTSEFKRMRAALLKRKANLRRVIGLYDEALEDYEDVVKCAKELGDQRGEADGLYGLGLTNSNIGNFEIALGYFNESLNIRKQINDKHGEGRILSDIGYVRWNLGDFPTARKCYEQARRICRGIRDRPGEATALRGVGAADYCQGHFEDAFKRYVQARKIWRPIDTLMPGTFYSGIAKVYHILGSYERALKHCKRHLKIERQIGDKHNETYTLDAIGEIYTARGEFELAVSHFEQALTLQRKIGEKGFQGYTLNNIGYIHYRRGDYTKALDYFEQGLRHVTEVGTKPAQAFLVRSLVLFWLDIGRVEKAVELTEYLGRLAEMANTDWIRAWMQIYTGRIKVIKGYYDIALLDIQKGLHIARNTTKEIWAIMEGLIAAAGVGIARKNNSEAREYLSEAHSIAVDKGRKPDIAQTNLLFARICLTEDNLQKAESYANKSQNIAESVGTKEILWQAHHMQGKIYLKKKDYLLAHKEMNEADKVISTISSNLSDALRKTYLKKEDTKEFYKDLRNIKMKSNKGIKS